MTDNNGAIYNYIRNWSRLIGEYKSFDIDIYNQMIIDGIHKINYIAELIKSNPECGINKVSFYTLKNTYVYFLYVLSIYNNDMYKFIPIGINHTKYGDVYYINVIINGNTYIVSTKYNDDWYSVYLKSVFTKNVYDEYSDNITYTIDDSVNPYNEYQNIITWFCEHNWFHLSQHSGNQQLYILQHILKDTCYNVHLNPGDNIYKLTSYYTSVYGYYYNFDNNCIYYTKASIVDIRYIFNESYIQSNYSTDFWFLSPGYNVWKNYKKYPIFAENTMNILPGSLGPTPIKKAIFDINKHVSKKERMNK